MKINKITPPGSKIRQSNHIYAVKIRTESNGFGVLKTFIVLLLIALQASFMILSYLYFIQVFRWYAVISIIATIFSCVHVLSSDYHGQAKATWILFLLICFSFGYIFYFLSDKHILFAKSKRKYDKIFNKTKNLQHQPNLNNIKAKEVRTNCEYLYNSGNFITHTNSSTTYFPSGASLFDDILESLATARDFIFIEYFIIADGVLLQRMLEILKEKAKKGVDVRIIYDDMGSHGTLKRKTKKDIIKSGIKLLSFNRLVPVINIALNLRNHRKIVIIDGKTSYTGGANLADEYTNEKRTHGYWKDSGIRIDGRATDNLTISFLNQWQFLTNTEIDYTRYIDIAEDKEFSHVTIPFVSGPNYRYSIAQNMFTNIIADAKEKLYIMTPYFVPDETITNLLINKAKSGVDVRIILPDIADKKFVYIVSRNNAEKLLNCGIKLYTMSHSFVHSKVILTEHSAIVGSINMDLRSFYQQFESAVYTNEATTLSEINKDFDKTLTYSLEVTEKNMRRNSIFHKILAGLFNLISPFM